MSFTGKEKAYIYIYLPTPPHEQDVTQGQFLKQSSTGLNSEFSFSYTSYQTMVKEPSLSCYLPIAGGRIGFIPFPRVLALCEYKQFRPGIELGSTTPFPTTLTIRPRVSMLNLTNAVDWLVY